MAVNTEPGSTQDVGQTPEDMVITILLVDDQPQVLRGLEMLVALERDLRVIGAAATAEAGIPLARRLQPNVIVMDVRLPGMDGITATRRLGLELPQCKVVVLSLYGDPDTRRRALQAGAHAFVAKHDTHGPLLATIRQVAARVPRRSE